MVFFLFIAGTCLVTSMGGINVGCVIFLEPSLFHGSNVRAVFKKGFKSQLLINLLPVHRRSEQIEYVGYCRETP